MESFTRVASGSPEVKLADGTTWLFAVLAARTGLGVVLGKRGKGACVGQR